MGGRVGRKTYAKNGEEEVEKRDKPKLGMG